MHTTPFTRAALLALLLCVGLVAASKADDRTPEKILADINAVEMPRQPAQFKSREEQQAFISKIQKALEQKGKLIGELYKADPENAELVSLLPTRWQSLAMSGQAEGEDKAREEIKQVLATSKDEKLKVEAAFFKVLMSFRKAGRGAEAAALMPVVDEFIKQFPKDDRGALMLEQIAAITTDDAKKLAIQKRIEADYPDSRAAKNLAVERRQKESIGKPFDLEFIDAIHGSPVSIKALKGKVVVIDFWATWCGPCINEMPNMKKLYAQYKDKGVEFIGVSLDQPKEKGGLDKLKDYVGKNGIEWPQYYQGNYWQSEFSASWGVNSIPCVFLVDADGNLASTEARGKLEEMIPEYLNKSKKN